MVDQNHVIRIVKSSPLATVSRHFSRVVNFLYEANVCLLVTASMTGTTVGYATEPNYGAIYKYLCNTYLVISSI